MAESESKGSWVKDLILLAIFFMTIYVTTYILTHYGKYFSDIFDLVANFLKTPYGLAVMFFIGMVSGAYGIKEVYSSVYRGRSVAFGFALIFLSSLIFIVLFITVIAMLTSFMENLLSFLNR